MEKVNLPNQMKPALIERKLCALCRQQIDSSKYNDHIEICMGQQGIPSKSTPLAKKAHSAYEDSKSLYNETCMDAVNVDECFAYSASNSVMIPSIVKKLTDICPYCSYAIDVLSFDNHIMLCSGESLTNTYSSSQTHINVAVTHENKNVMASVSAAGRSSKKDKQTKDCTTHLKVPDLSKSDNHLLSPSPEPRSRQSSHSSSHRNADTTHVNNDRRQRPRSAACSLQNSQVTINSNSSIKLCTGDLITQQTDVIVVCSSSEYLFNTICKAGGDSIKTLFNEESKKNPKPSVIAINAGGQVTSKKIYFLEWKRDSNKDNLSKSIKKFVSDALENAINENYQSIAFPAIGCGKIGCSISVVAQTMVEEAHRILITNPMSVSFVIQSERNDIYNEFQKQINLLQQQELPQISTKVGKGVMEVEKGDITIQKVDVIIGNSSSVSLRQAILNAGGKEVQSAYNIEQRNNPNAILISTLSGSLPCKRIFFLKWKPDGDEATLRQSLVDLVWTVMQHLNLYNFTSIAFPAIGCGKHDCSVDFVVKTLVKEMKNQLTMRNLPLTIKFIVEADQQNIYDEFCKQVLTTLNADVPESADSQLPSTWVKSKENKILFVLSSATDEYKSILTDFDQAMKGQYTQIIQLERIQNERWYMQYLAHSRDFKRRLNRDSEKRLYHGCPEKAVNLIVEDCFNRSFAGVNGTTYGAGVYFSSNAVYSHGFAKPNAKGKRRMFVASVLVGKTTKGDTSMKTRPLGVDSTTDGRHIFVTYHDAQAYAEYLITYK